ncbi:MAG: sigma-70 family RNA polymerase sigma factor, partial [Planctomycetaceae bacterium]|nr:sigma-70 family RNA polymerase sigma factor [Planctomycetaceae bacterium]
MTENSGRFEGVDDPDHRRSSAGPSEEFIRLFTQNQRAVFLSILPMVASPADAEEVLQETNVVILSKWEQFQPGSNFLAWCRAIARLEVFRFRRRDRRRAIHLDDAIVEIIAARVDEQSSADFDQRREALARCVEQLREKDQDLLRLRYAVGASGDDVAEQLGRPANSVYQSLGRIRRT